MPRSLKCHYWNFHTFAYTSVEAEMSAFQLNDLNLMVSGIFGRFCIFLGIFIFFPPDLYVQSSFANVQLFKSICVVVNHTWWMRSFSFKLKQSPKTCSKLIFKRLRLKSATKNTFMFASKFCKQMNGLNNWLPFI